MVRRTDGPTNRVTYRVACTRLKINNVLFFLSRVHATLQVTLSVGWSVRRSVTLYFFQPKSDLTSVTAPAKRTRLMLSCIRPCFHLTHDNLRYVTLYTPCTYHCITFSGLIPNDVPIGLKIYLTSSKLYSLFLCLVALNIRIKYFNIVYR